MKYEIKRKRTKTIVVHIVDDYRFQFMYVCVWVSEESFYFINGIFFKIYTTFSASA